MSNFHDRNTKRFRSCGPLLTDPSWEVMSTQRATEICPADWYFYLCRAFDAFHFRRIAVPIWVARCRLFNFVMRQARIARAVAAKWNPGAGLRFTLGQPKR